MILKNKRIFITGGAGFIGSNLAERLSKNNKVTIYDFKEDIFNWKKLGKVIKNHDIVFHLAANSDVRENSDVSDIGMMNNVLGMMRRNNIKNIVFTSSSTVFGEEGYPISYYGATKIANEGLITAFCHYNDASAWIFRLANIVGKNLTHGVVYDFIEKLKKDPTRLEILGDGKQTKCYLDVQDLIDAMLLAIEKTNKQVNILDIASNTYTNVDKIAKIVSDEMKLNPKITYTGGERGWKGDVPIVKMDNAKISKLGWKPKLNSDDAIRNAVNINI